MHNKIDFYKFNNKVYRTDALISPGDSFHSPNFKNGYKINKHITGRDEITKLRLKLLNNKSDKLNSSEDSNYNRFIIIKSCIYDDKDLRQTFFALIKYLYNVDNRFTKFVNKNLPQIETILQKISKERISDELFQECLKTKFGYNFIKQYNSIKSKFDFSKKYNYKTYKDYIDLPNLYINILKNAFTYKYLEKLKNPRKKHINDIKKYAPILFEQMLGVLFWNCTKNKKIYKPYKKGNSSIINGNGVIDINYLVKNQQQLLTKTVNSLVDIYCKDKNSKNASINPYMAKKIFLELLEAKALELNSNKRTYYLNCSTFYTLSTNKENLIKQILSLIYKTSYNLYYIYNNMCNFSKIKKLIKNNINDIKQLKYIKLCDSPPWCNRVWL